MSYIIYRGINSRKYGLTARLPVKPMTARTVKSIEIPGRSEPLNIWESTMRKNIQIPVTLGITDIRRIHEVYQWLQGSGDLILSDDPDKKYHAFVGTDITPERLSRRFGTINIVFICAPYAYSVYNPFWELKLAMSDKALTAHTTFYVSGNAECEPLMFFKVAGKLKVTVNGETPFFITTAGNWINQDDVNNVQYKYNVEEIYIDSSIKQAYTYLLDDKVAVTNKTSGRFPILRNDDNIIEFELIDTAYSVNKQLTVFKCQNNERWY